MRFEGPGRNRKWESRSSKQGFGNNTRHTKGGLLNLEGSGDLQRDLNQGETWLDSFYKDGSGYCVEMD